MSKKSKDTEPKDHSSAKDEAATQPEGQESIEQLRKERDDLLARLQRVSADYLNYQKRIQRDLEASRQFANAELIKALLPVLDDMERVLAATRDNHGQDDPLYKGMELVHTKALETLGKFGLKPIEAVGQAFDPQKHSAMSQQPSDQHEPQTVLQELVRGYELNGRTLRPSGVVVSTRPRQETEQPQRQDDQANDPACGQAT